MRKPALYLSLLLAVLPLASCADDKAVPAAWKTECIGRYTIGLPSEVEVALHPTENFSRGGRAKESAHQFNDGVYNINASVYVDGTIEISKKINTDLIEKYKLATLKLRNERLEVKRNLAADGKSINTDWSRGAAVSIFENNRLYIFDSVTNGKSKDDLIEAQKRRNIFIKNLSSRALFEVPEKMGLCIPYAFVKDKGDMYRDISVAMRLVDHPDVEIFFKDGNATKGKENTAPEFKGSRGEVEFFWSYYGPSVGNQLQGTLNHYHDIKLGGYTGKYAFATIARSNQPNEPRSKDGETVDDYKARVKKEIAEDKRPLDYGFMAYYKGDPSKTDEPDLMLYVIRTASRAVAAGKQPVSEDELKLMALQIAASVKRRPVE
jgi:hypothetical protein